ncbi:MAG: TIGR04282 family arsenosugar biosynthesis glycosyltransferase [Hyphomicrobiaceae bacterium]|nr:TIGR04282 family arsenosugar biosynthesis glycosyltransferase [Hyphomicrobiaceae bacterium]
MSFYSEATFREALQRAAAPQCCAPRRWLVIMVKAPLAGRVKTRLGRDIGVVAATSFYRQAARAVIARVGRDPRWRTVLAVDPGVACHARFWPSHLLRVPQGGGDLGERMQRCIDAMPPGPVVLIGTDIPSIRADHIARAFALLGNSDAVFGPAVDGGFWLVGQRRLSRRVGAFDDVRWSAADTLGDVLDNHAGLAVAMADRLSDVDSAAELELCGGRSGCLALPPRP